MKNDLRKLIGPVFCTLLGAFFLGFLLLPKSHFSVREKRFLADQPSLSLNSLTSGDFEQQAEAWSADHIPFRNGLVELNAVAERAMNLQTTKDVIVGKNGSLYERPAVFNEKKLRQDMEIINAFAEEIGCEIDFALIPSAGALMPENLPLLADDYEDEKIIETAFASASEKLKVHDLYGLFVAEGNKNDLFYRTDHHWTSYGAYQAFCFLLREMGREAPAELSYTKEKAENFYGSLYSRAGFWGLKPDEIELWSRPGSFRVSFSDRKETYEDLFFREHLKEPDQYPIWLDGNHPLVKIENTSGEGKGKLLVIRDSFSNCLGCFLAEAYENVTLVDLRYYKDSVSELFREGMFDEVMVIFSVNHFVSDTNLAWLR